MSNYRALGFTLASRHDAKELALAPVRSVNGVARQREGQQVKVHRLEIGDGLELWSIVAGRTLVASYPTFVAREPHLVTVGELTFDHGPWTPRLWFEPPGLTCQLANYPLADPEALRPGARAWCHLAGLAADGLDETAAGPSCESLGDHQYRVTGAVVATAELRNLSTLQPLWWGRIDLGSTRLELVAHARDCPAITPGQTVTGVVTLRGSLAGLGEVPPVGQDEQA